MTQSKEFDPPPPSAKCKPTLQRFVANLVSLTTVILAVDVDYRSSSTACVAGVTFENWTSKRPSYSVSVDVPVVAEYQAGQFFKRELPCIIQLLDALSVKPDIIIVDGYVWLDDNGKPGLGAHLFDSLLRCVPVVGVAKSRFQKNTHAHEVLRGRSKKPLFITAAGIPDQRAAELVKAMHGAYRMPTLLRRVDRICRGLEKPKVSK